MSPFIQEVLGTIIRAALVWLSAWLASHGGPKLNDDQIAHYVLTATPVVAAVGWSIWSKYKGRLKLNVALGTAAVLTEKEAAAVVAAGQAPSVNTPSTVVPSTK